MRSLDGKASVIHRFILMDPEFFLYATVIWAYPSKITIDIYILVYFGGKDKTFGPKLSDWCILGLRINM